MSFYKPLFWLVLLSVTSPQLLAQDSGSEPATAYSVMGDFDRDGYQYHIEVLFDLPQPNYYSAFDHIEAGYRRLNDEQKAYLALFVLMNWRLDGERAFRFRKLIEPDAKKILDVLSRARKDRFEKFCVNVGGSKEMFVTRAESFLGETPANLR